MYIIKHNTTHLYLARSGSPQSYTRTLRQAQLFLTRLSASVEACGNENVYPLTDQFFATPR